LPGGGNAIDRFGGQMQQGIKVPTGTAEHKIGSSKNSLKVENTAHQQGNKISNRPLLDGGQSKC